MRKQISYLSMAQVKTRVEKLRTDSRQICETFILRFVQYSTIPRVFILLSGIEGERGIGEAERDGIFTCAKRGRELSYVAVTPSFVKVRNADTTSSSSD
jgi:hypothetical protein